jgi:hypothetical protein
MSDFVKVALLTYGCVLCVQSIGDTIRSVPPRQWADVKAALDRDGLWHLGPFEVAVPEVRLSDRSKGHTYCGPGCKAKEVGR